MYIAFDVGGTKIRVAKSNDCKVFDEPVIRDNKKDFEGGISQLIETIKEVAVGEDIEGISGDIAGVLAGDCKTLVVSPNLPDWLGKPVVERIREEFRAPVFIENDADVIALGEAIAGAGKDFPIIAYITVSTGVGGGRVVNGVIDNGRIGFEPGHQIIDFENMRDLESFVSGSAFEKKFGKKAYEIDQSDEAWDWGAKILAVGLHNTIIHWSPDVIVLGGRMMTGDPAIKIDYVKRYLKKIMKIFPVLPEIKLAELGDIGGIHGSLAHLRQKMDI